MLAPLLASARSRTKVFSASASAVSTCSSSARCALTSRCEVLSIIEARSSCVWISASVIEISRLLVSIWVTTSRSSSSATTAPASIFAPSPKRTSSTRPETSLRSTRSSPSTNPV